MKENFMLNESAYFISHDGVQLYYQHWLPERTDISKLSQKAIIMFHRGHEHSDRLKHIVAGVGLNDYHFFAWDASGHGKAPGVRGFAPNVAHVVKDIDTFIKHIHSQYGIAIEDMIVLGQSVGAVAVATWLHDYAPKVKAAILASPAFKVKLYVPFAIPGLKLAQKLAQKDFFVKSYVKGHFLSHDPKRIIEYNTDPNITLPISVNMLLDLHTTSARIVTDAYAISQPVLMLVSGMDFVVEKEPQYSFFAKLSSPQKELHELPEFYHDTLGEDKRELAYQYIRQFIQKIGAQQVVREDLTQKNDYHFSWLEHQSLKNSQHPIEKHLFKLQKKALDFGAKFSDALKLGQDKGFDSGSMLDYVYKNEASSQHPLGRAIDKVYLNAIGWRGIRVRRENLDKAFTWSVNKINQLTPDITLKFVDIAAGHGRYDLDFIKHHTGQVQAILSDYSETNVLAGTALIHEYGLGAKVQFLQGNAFSEAYVQKITDNANLVVVSGLYELYSDNELIQTSLKGITEGMQKGGFLVYTNQPWHPQLKFIANVLTSHKDGNSWVMRRRTQEEMDQLVESYGFEKIEQFIDPYGIFTVSIARKL